MAEQLHSVRLHTDVSEPLVEEIVGLLMEKQPEIEGWTYEITGVQEFNLLLWGEGLSSE